MFGHAVRSGWKGNERRKEALIGLERRSSCWDKPRRLDGGKQRVNKQPSRLMLKTYRGQRLMDGSKRRLRHPQSTFIYGSTLHELRIEICPPLSEYTSVLADKAPRRCNLFRSRPAVSICFRHAIKDGSTCCDNRRASAHTPAHTPGHRALLLS